EAAGLKAQLNQLGLTVKQIQQGKIYQKVPIISPLNGYVQDIPLKIGAYVSPKESLFSIIDNTHLHADFRVFEKDMAKIRKGQLISFRTEAYPDKGFTAKIFAIGKQFE